MSEYIWGRNPILETLHSARRVKRILLAEGVREAPAIETMIEEAEQRHIPVEVVPRNRLDDILANAASKNEPPFLLILDAIQDVNNLGSLLRTAEAAGIHGIIIPEHRAAEVNATVVKTSAGASEHLLIARETNLTRAIDYLKKQQVWVIGLVGEAQTLYTQADLTGPLALVVGNEGKGISRLVREHCDLLIKLPMHGSINSLNAAIAGSIALYEALRQRSARKQ
jgi:23S rRNA (guanosine2251-2'-O)-methyltransferase